MSRAVEVLYLLLVLTMGNALQSTYRSDWDATKEGLTLGQLCLKMLCIALTRSARLGTSAAIAAHIGGSTET